MRNVWMDGTDLDSKVSKFYVLVLSKLTGYAENL